MLPRGAQQQTHWRPLLLSINGTDRRKDARATQTLLRILGGRVNDINGQQHQLTDVLFAETIEKPGAFA